MKLHFTLRSILLFTCLLLSIHLQSQVTSKTVHVETPGTLPTLINQNLKYILVHLTLTGNLNGDDFRYIFEMAGRDVDGKKTSGKLTDLNLSGARIVSGGNCYYYDTMIGKQYFTSNDSIGARMFFGRTQLTSITLPSTVTYIGQRAFSDCTGLESFLVPTSVTSIADSAFSDCSNLVNLGLYQGVKSIGKRAFLNCSKMPGITIPASVTSIDSLAFGGCTGLNSFYVYGENTSYCHSEGVLFNKDKTTLIACPNQLSKIYTIPSTVSSIADYAFAYCDKITSITIPESVTSIGKNAFMSCTSIRLIHNSNPNPQTIDSAVISGIDTTICRLFVPGGSLSAFRSASGWSKFANLFEGEPTYTVVLSSGTGGRVQINNLSERMKTFKKGDSFQLNVIPSEGYEISEALLNGADLFFDIRDNRYYVSSITDDMVFYITFKKSDVYYTITSQIENEKGGTIAIAPYNDTSVRVKEGSFLDIRIIPQEGYELERLVSTAIGSTDGIDITESVRDNRLIWSNVEQDRNFLVEFREKLKYNLTLNYAESGSFVVEVGHRQPYTCKLEPAEGWSINTIRLNDTDFTSELKEGNWFTVPSMIGDLTLSVSFEKSIASIDPSRASTIKVYTEGESIVIEGAEPGEQISVYTESGSFLTIAKATGDRIKMNVSKGRTYLIKTTEKTFKVVL